VETHYRVRRTPDSRILAGTSAGGLAAAYIAFRYPTVFGNVLSQSGAFWRSNESSDQPPYEWLTQQLANAPKLPVKFYLDVGTRETDRALGGAAPSQLDSNRRLHGVLKAKGYAVKYVEVQNGGHSAESWRQQLPIALVALAPVARPPDSLPAPASSGGR
jgi:enterochelin esterase family protein